MLRGDAVWVEPYFRGSYARGRTPVAAHLRTRAARRRRRGAPPAQEPVAAYTRGDHVLPAHHVPGYWRRRPHR